MLVSILKHPFTTKLLRRMAAAQLYFDHEKGAVGARSEFEKLQSVSGGDVSAALLEHESTEWMQSTVAEFQEYFSSGGGVEFAKTPKRSLTSACYAIDCRDTSCPGPSRYELNG